MQATSIPTFFDFVLLTTRGQRGQQQEAALPVIDRRSGAVRQPQWPWSLIWKGRQKRSAAARLLKAYAMQVEVLRRLRHGTGQYVRVEHVHIHEGGQAVIGNVMAREGDRERSSSK
ncbi:MAG TPA: hypothetical protein VIF02_13305 [Methylocella sp.]|jgi:hypothetical protein